MDRKIIELVDSTYDGLHMCHLLSLLSLFEEASKEDGTLFSPSKSLCKEVAEHLDNLYEFYGMVNLLNRDGIKLQVSGRDMYGDTYIKNIEPTRDIATDTKLLDFVESIRNKSAALLKTLQCIANAKQNERFYPLLGKMVELYKYDLIRYTADCYRGMLCMKWYPGNNVKWFVQRTHEKTGELTDVYVPIHKPENWTINELVQKNGKWVHASR